MEGFVSFKNVKITDELVNTLKTKLNWSIFTVGKSKTHVTKYGGVHYSGKLTFFPAVIFEIRRDNAYIMVSLLEYPKGIIMHVHIYYPDIKKKSDWKQTVEKVYKEIGSYIVPSSDDIEIVESV